MIKWGSTKKIKSKGQNLKDLIMQFVDEKMLVPVYLAIFIGSLVFWGQGIDQSSKEHELQIRAIRKAMQTNHTENLQNMEKIEDLLRDINKSIGIVEGKVSIIERQVKQ